MTEIRILPCSTEKYIYGVIYTRSLGNYHIGKAVCSGKYPCALKTCWKSHCRVLH